jgi:Ca2+-binding EF-hand superfamily protein
MPQSQVSKRLKELPQLPSPTKAAPKKGLRNLGAASKSLAQLTPKKLSTRIPSHLKDVCETAIQEARDDAESQRRRTQIAAMAAGVSVLPPNRLGATSFGASDKALPRCSMLEKAAARRSSVDALVQQERKSLCISSASAPSLAPENKGASSKATRASMLTMLMDDKPGRGSILSSGTELVEKPRIEPGDVARFSRKYHIDLTEVKDILRFFEESDQNNSEGLDKDEFEKILRRIFNVSNRDMPMHLVNQAWRRIQGEYPKAKRYGAAEASLDNFLQWYSENMFNHAVLNLEGDSAGLEALATKYDVSFFDVEKIKSIFDSFDANRSGRIDRGEFRAMLVHIFKAKAEDDIPGERADRFWSEIKQDNSMTISFPEFCAWYIKTLTTDENSGSMASKLYNSFARPTVFE